MIRKIKKALPLLFGFRSRAKIVVIESDDWGAVRTSSKKSFQRLLKKGYPVDQSPYNKFDSLESNSDLEGLLEVLSSVKNGAGESPKMTLNYIMANPDFEKIKMDNFQNYHFENSVLTRSRYKETNQLGSLYSQGIKDAIIKPQLHGREHLNVKRWMNGLANKEKHLLEAFDEEMYSLKWDKKNIYPNEYMDALDIDSQEEIIGLQEIITDASVLFEKTWGFTSKSFIACCYIWPSEIHQTLKGIGVEHIQGLPIQFRPTLKPGVTYNKKYHYTGQVSNEDQYFLVRNAFFEPSVYPKLDNVNECLSRIDMSFKFGKPAIISSHRLNFMGRLVEKNRSDNLVEFKILLQEIVSRWPDVKFMFSDELGDFIKGN